jgi:electron transfer flavoprotein alpha subunit
MGARALVIAETRDGALTALTLELVALARSLAETHSPAHEGTKPFALSSSEDAAEVVCLVMHDDARAAQSLVAHGADRVFVCPAQREEYESEVWVEAAAKLALEVQPGVIVAAHTPAGSDLAPRLAFRLKSGVATGCVAVDIAAGRIVCTRPVFGGNARESVSFDTGAAVVTVRSGVGEARRDEARRGEIVRLQKPASARRVRVIARERENAAGTRLEDAKVVVAGGRGLEGPEGFEVLERLAGVLGAAVGSSRVPCDLGWVPHSKQIGLTGKTVTPDLYFAVGISGAGHHMAGCGNARAIVAINTDPDAAIFRDARFGVVGDYRNVVPALAAAIEELKNAR